MPNSLICNHLNDRLPARRAGRRGFASCLGPYLQDFQQSPESRQPLLAVNAAKKVQELIENMIPERLTGSKARWLSYIKDAGLGHLGILEQLNSKRRLGGPLGG